MASPEFVFLKLGGAVITDKYLRPKQSRSEGRAYEHVIAHAAVQVRASMEARPGLRLLIGHGSGSFGHPAHRRTGFRERRPDGWDAYRQVRAATAKLHAIVTEILVNEGLPVVSFQPSSAAVVDGGKPLSFPTDSITTVLSHGGIPLVYGDVVIDRRDGFGILSTEPLFAYLAQELKPARLVFATDVAGVYSSNPKKDPSAVRYPVIDSLNVGTVLAQLARSPVEDETGGMEQKVRVIFELVRDNPGMRAWIVSGNDPESLRAAVLDEPTPEGTLLAA
jgi:isopentenyl phosphate kinase